MDEVIQKFERFKSIFISSNLPNKILLELIESFIFSDNRMAEDKTVEVFESQLSLFDLSEKDENEERKAKKEMIHIEI